MAQSTLSLPDSGDLHLVSGPRTTPTVFVVDWHATGLALAGVVLAAGGVWLRWRSPRRASVGDVYLRCPDGTTRPGQDSTGTNRSRRAWQRNCPGDVAAHRLDHRVLAVDACSCGWIWRRSSTRGSHRALRRPLHALPATGIAPQLPIRPVGSRGVHGQSWRQERFWCRGQTCPPFGVAPNLHTTAEAPIRQRAHPGNCQRPIQHASPNPQSGPARRSFPSPAAAAPWANW